MQRKRSNQSQTWISIMSSVRNPLLYGKWRWVNGKRIDKLQYPNAHDKISKNNKIRAKMIRAMIQKLKLRSWNFFYVNVKGMPLALGWRQHYNKIRHFIALSYPRQEIWFEIQTVEFYHISSPLTLVNISCTTKYHTDVDPNEVMISITKQITWQTKKIVMKMKA